MAPTSSPRDHDADANPEVSRKRARLSEEGDSASSRGSVEIEALAPELISEDPTNAIAMDGGDSMTLPYSDSFVVFPDTDAIAQVRLLHHSLGDPDTWVEPQWILNVMEWLEEHVEATEHESMDSLLQKYGQEDVFFGEFAKMAWDFFQTESMFRAEDLRRYAALRTHIQSFAENLMRLSARFIVLAPQFTKEQLARRDSAQIALRPREQEIPALYYLRLADLLLRLHDSNVHYLKYELGLKTKATREQCRALIPDDDVAASSLVAVLRDICQHVREFKDSWAFIDIILSLSRHSLFQGVNAVALLEITNHIILPAVREKHPRALPESFHGHVVKYCGGILNVQDTQPTFEDAYPLYERVVKGDDDALFSERQTGSEGLRQLCNYDVRLVRPLLRAAWVLQAYKSFILSSIMDIRSCGITLLSQELSGWHRNYCDVQDGGPDHPVIQYAARFLRKNDLIDYIFSANSHASIITHSKLIVTFLALTFNYTDRETDIIWQACTTSVEADFVKASFAVLLHVSRHLGFQQLQYCIKKFVSAPVAAISSKTAVETLSAFFRHVQEAMPTTDAQQIQLAPVMLGLDLLNHVESQDRTPATRELVDMAMAEISRACDLGTEARLQVYERCAPAIVGQSPSATPALMVMALFLQAGVPAQEAGLLTAMLPAKVVVDELRHYVEQAKQSGLVDWNAHCAGLICRVNVITHILSLTAQRALEIEDALFRHLLGEGSIANFARNVGWTRLGELAKDRRGPKAAVYLLDRYFADLVPSLAADHATVVLIQHLTERLAGSAPADPVQAQTEYLALFELPLWQVLVRLAAESADQKTAEAAINAVCCTLFLWPQDFKDKAAVVECHVNFVRSFVDRLCTEFADVSNLVAESGVRRFCQTIDVLRAVLAQSRATAASYELHVEADSIALGDNAGDDDALDFSAQICSPESRQATINVQASTSTTVGDLAGALPGRTGTANNKVIIGGRVLDMSADAAKTLSEVGIQASSTITVYPTYTPDCDLDKLSTGPGPVEQEILAHHDRLESFLDGPSVVARSAYDLLSAMKLSPSARSKITEAHTVAALLFPPERPYRTVYSLHILSSFLQTCARLAVADEKFILRGTHLLIDFMMDKSHVPTPVLMHRVADVLLQFLLGKLTPEQHPPTIWTADKASEKPSDAVPTQYFDAPTAFVGRVLDIISQTLALEVRVSPSPQVLPVRTALVLAMYNIMLQACRIDGRIWNALSEDEQSAPLHAQMLLDDDIGLSGRIAERIQNFCIDQPPPTDRAERYWRIVIAATGQALERPFAATAYFHLAANLLNCNVDLQTDEAKARNLIHELLDKVRGYAHHESPVFPGTDIAMTGLLRLLKGAIVVMRSFKKPLGLGSVSEELFERLLFPSAGAPLLSEDARAAVFDIVKATCESPVDYQSLATSATQAIDCLPDNANNKFPGLEGWIRSPGQCAGLTNLGMTCYMNSLLQILFANLAFRKFLFDTPVVDAEKQIFLHKVQCLFTHMQDGPMCAAATSELARVLGVQIQNQEDVHGFYADFLSRLEESMPDGERKSAFSKFYNGKFVSQIKGSCGHVSTKSEPFNDVAVTVKNKASLSDSLNEFVQGEPMQGANRYRCHTCNPQDGLLVDAMKRTCLDEVPNNLTFCLKRFTFESMMGMEGKVNDRFEFPQQIDMAIYERAHVEQQERAIDPDVFELVGVIVHQGSLEFGHYWSYTRLAGSSTWVRLEDQNVQICESIEDVQHHCYGGLCFTNGQERTDNGYVLFYQRRSHVEEQAKLVMPLSSPAAWSPALPPRVPAPAEIARTVASESLWRHRIANIFSPQFSSLIEWLISTYPAANACSSDDEAMVDSPRVDDVEGPAAVAAKYLLRVVLTDLASLKKLRASTQAITSAFETHGTAFARRILQAMVDEQAFLAAIWTHSMSEYRAAASTLLERCLKCLRASDDGAYMELFRQIVHVHAGLLSNLDAIYGQWSEYFGFAAALARFGVRETAILLDCGYLSAIFEVMYVTWHNEEIRRKHQLLFNLHKSGHLKQEALFVFMHSVLSEHVDVFGHDRPPQLSNRHDIVDGLVRLTAHEWQMMTIAAGVDQSEIWLLAHVGCQTCPATATYETYAPGQLVALLTGPNSPPSVVQSIERALFVRFEAEQIFLKEMLFVALHFCSSRGDQCSRNVVRQLGKNLPLWPKCEPEILKFCAIAAKLVPSSVIETVPEWAAKFLKTANARVRQTTNTWLQHNVFVDAQPDAPQTASRLRACRALAKQCLPYLRDGYYQEHTKSRYEEMFEAIAAESSWLSALHSEMELVLNDNEKRQALHLSAEVMVEYDESKTTLKSLKQTMLELCDWESELLPLPGMDGLAEARHSVETVEDSELDADEDDDDALSSDFEDDQGS